MAIGQISIDVVASLARFRQDMATVGKVVTDQMREVNSAVAGIKGSLDLLTNALAAVGVGFSIKSMAGFITDTIEATARIKDQSEALGISTQAYQALSYAAAATGTSQQVLETSVAKLTRTIGEAVAGDKQAVAVFEQLGVATRTASGEVRSTESVLTDVAEALSKIPSVAERARLEVALFGKGAQQFDAMMRDGAASLEALASQAQNLGLVFDKDMIEKAAQTEGAIRILKMQWDSFAELLIAKLTPAIINLLKELSNLFNLTNQKTSMPPALKDSYLLWGDINEEVKKTIAHMNELDQTTGLTAVAQAKLNAEYDAAAAKLEELLKLKARMEFKISEQTSEIGERQRDPSLKGTSPLTGVSHAAGIGFVATGESQAEKDAKAMAQTVAGLKAESEALAGNSDAIKLNAALLSAHAAAGSENAAIITRMVEGIQGQTQAQEADKKAWQEHTEEVKAADALIRSLEPKVDKLAEDQALLNKYLADGVITQQEYAKASANVKTAIEAQDTAAKKFSKSLNDMASDMKDEVGSSLADLATGATTWQEAMSSALRLVINDVLKLIDVSSGKTGGGGLLGILGSIGSAILGSAFGAAGSGIVGGAAISIPTTPTAHLAGGGALGAGQWAVVGEHGPELWSPDTPGTVIPNSVSAAMMSGGGGPTYNIDARGADSAAIARLEATLRELHRSIEPRAVAAVGAMRKRGGTFAAAFAR